MGHKPARAWKSQNTEYVTRINKTGRHFYWNRQDSYWGFGNSTPENSSVELSISTRCGEQEGKYYAATGTTGFRWLESEMVKELGKEDDIDISYYTKLVDDAVDAISKHGDFEWFVSDDPYIPKPKLDFMDVPDVDDEEVPF